MAKKMKNFGISSNVTNSHKSAQIVSFIPKDNPEFIKKLSVITFEGDKLSKNYVEIDWYKFDAISVYLKNHEICGFSSVWHRPEFYEPMEARILNRYWENPSFRRISKIIADNHLIEMINQQITISKYLGFNKIFISREKSPKYFRKLILNIENKTGFKWQISTEKVCVCSPSAPSCWQYKAWTYI